MDICPPEIWDEICSFACTDDGHTGRSLSLVSHSFNAISKHYKFQSIAVVGRTQILGFAALFKRTPPPLRRVISIYISYRNGGIEESVRQKPEDLEVCFTIERILRAIAPSVEVLHLMFVGVSWFIRHPGNLNMHLPVLKDFVVHYPFFVTTPAGTEPTALKYIKVTHACTPREVFDIYLARAPNITTHISFRCDYGEDTQLWLAAYLTSNDGRFTLPSRLERLYIHPIMPPNNCRPQILELYKRTTQLLVDFAQTDQRVLLMPPLQLSKLITDPVSSQTAMSMWTATVEGRNWWEQ